MVRLHRHREHVNREDEKLAQVRGGEKPQSGGELLRRFVTGGRRSREHESPLAEGWNIHVIRPGAQPRLLQSFIDAPIRFAREQRRRALDYQKSATANMAR